MANLAAKSDLDSLIERGNSHLRAKRFEQAEAAFRSVIQVQSNSIEAWKGLSLSAFNGGRYADAETRCRKALALNPRNPEIRQLLAASLRALKSLDEANSIYEELVKQRPNDAALLNNWGNALSDAGRVEQAVQVLHRAVHADPKPNMYRINLVRALIKRGHAEEALAVLEPATPETSTDLDLVAEYGNALLAAKRYKESIAAYRRAQAGGHQNAGMLHNLGTALQWVGAMEEAEAAYREAVKSDPASVVSLRQLSGIRKFNGSEPDIVELQKVLHQPGASITVRSEAYMALAKAFDDIGDYDRAFTHLQAGNQLIRTTIDYSAADSSAIVDHMIEVFTRDFLRERASWGLETERPIFVIGMPRSGTTLTEQILCSHPKVFGAGELMKIYEIIVRLRRSMTPDRGLPGVATLLDQDGTRGAAQAYLTYLNSLNADLTFVSDKLPFNFRFLGFISLFFPKARVIHCVRHPLDVGLSCYFARFSEQLSFSFNLVEIGGYYRDYERLMRHWAEVVPNPILNMSYESLVNDQERETRKMLEFCGLEWEDRCLEFHRTDRAVLTASNWQVRQPMYSSSVGRWRNYRKHLEPLIASLKMLNPDGWSGTGQQCE